MPRMRRTEAAPVSVGRPIVGTPSQLPPLLRESTTIPRCYLVSFISSNSATLSRTPRNSVATAPALISIKPANLVGKSGKNYSACLGVGATSCRRRFVTVTLSLRAAGFARADPDFSPGTAIRLQPILKFSLAPFAMPQQRRINSACVPVRRWCNVWCEADSSVTQLRDFDVVWAQPVARYCWGMKCFMQRTKAILSVGPRAPQRFVYL